MTPVSFVGAERPIPVDPAVFPLAVRRIVIDPGHGGRSTGTRSGDGALVEKDLALDIAHRLRGELEGKFEVLMTRRDDSELPLRSRAEFANSARADLFVSIHLNWLEDPKLRGIETYFAGATDDPVLARLAALENRESGYSLADFRNLLDRVYSTSRQQISQQVAAAIDRELHRSLVRVDSRVADRGVKRAPFVVLLSTEMPAVLAEVSCLSNPEEVELLARPLYRQYIAEALARGIRRFAAATAEPSTLAPVEPNAS